MWFQTNLLKSSNSSIIARFYLTEEKNEAIEKEFGSREATYTVSSKNP